MRSKKLLSPLLLPIHFFLLAIAVGTALLMSPPAAKGAPADFLDAMFTAVSAACVTGLAVLDTSSFTRFGQSVILALIQLGGLGVMTYTSLVFYLWRRRVSLVDRIAVGRSLLHDPTFSLGGFLTRMVLVTFSIEAAGALVLLALDPVGFAPFSAVFHSVSAFCNAGFSLFPDSLEHYRTNIPVNLTFMILITCGGLGFAVLIELYRAFRARLSNTSGAGLSRYARTVLGTSAFLVVGGAVLIYIDQAPEAHGVNMVERVLTSLFASVTCRTAGFNTLHTGLMAEASLVIMMLLMFIGGSPGSCAGGVKTTTFRALVAFSTARIRGRRQAVVGGAALDEETVNKAVTLLVFAAGIILVALLVLCWTEGAASSHARSTGRFLEILFETVSAFGTVGLSTGLTPELSPWGKTVVALLMFIGRLGPVFFISALQEIQDPPRFDYPETGMLVG